MINKIKTDYVPGVTYVVLRGGLDVGHIPGLSALKKIALSYGEKVSFRDAVNGAIPGTREPLFHIEARRILRYLDDEIAKEGRGK